jgi:hypothetical protein
MKRLYSGFLILFTTVAIQAQTPTFEITDDDNSNTAVPSNTTFVRSVAASALDQHHFTLKNISTSNQTVTIRKYEDVINTVNASDKAEAVFCTGSTCFPPTVSSAQVTLTPNQTIAFIADLTEASMVGESDTHYKFTNANDASEVTYVYFKYNVPAGLIKQSTFLSNVSAVYPNPVSSSAFLNVTAAKDIQTEITIVNALGSVVSSSSTELTKGKNTVKLPTENLNAGVYFVSLSNGSTIITRKIMITK